MTTFFHLRNLLTKSPFWYFLDATDHRESAGNLLTPLLFFSLDVNRRLLGLDPRGFYLHQLAALSLAAIALFGALRLWLPRHWAAVGTWTFLIGPVTASLAAMLMVHHYLEAICLAALATAAWAGAIQRSPGAGAWRWAVLSAVLYLAACLARAGLGLRPRRARRGGLHGADPRLEIPALRSDPLGAPLHGQFHVHGKTLRWELGPYRQGRYRFVVNNGSQAFEMPRKAGFQLAGRSALPPLRIGYESPAGWITDSPEIPISLVDGWSLRWARP